MYNGRAQAPEGISEANGVNGEVLRFAVGEGYVNAGTAYRATATFVSVDGGRARKENYNVTGLTSEEYSIEAYEVAIVWCDNAYTYNGGVQVITATYADVSGSNIPLNVTTDREFKNAGNYTATARFAYGETNYALPDNATAIYEIKKLEVSVIADNAEMPYGSTPARKAPPNSSKRTA